MLITILSLMMSVSFAKTDGCSLGEILKSAKPDKKCVEAYLAKIPNAEDRSEAKFRLQQWKPIKDLEVFSGEGMIEAVLGGKVFMRTIHLQRSKPMLIWMDGKILVDNSDNPSFARRLQNAMKKSKSAAINFLLPEAHAQETANTQQTLTMLYTLDEPNVESTAPGMIKNALEDFVPARSWLGSVFMGVKEIKCNGNLVETTELNPDEAYEGYGVAPRLKITAKSPTEFIITGLKPNQTHLVILNSQVSTYRQTGYRNLSARSAGDGATLVTCSDPKCDGPGTSDNFKNWDFIANPSFMASAGADNSKTKAPEYKKLNAKVQQDVVNRMFGLSVMGECCTNESCRNRMLERFNIKLTPASGETPATR